MKKYYRLLIIAANPATGIWVGDDEGNFVQKEVGRMESHLLPGRYTVEFGLGTTRRAIDLQDDLEIQEGR